uniref:Uncharacterized protein n=1 Tax=Tanacetum cinerariifolium TaxID=118510 RepID=A0A699TC79_TANCI|nr:hypothetical protein [Tanacetum cinerariifolium]
MSYASSAATYTSVYTDSEPWRFYRGSDEEPAEAGITTAGYWYKLMLLDNVVDSRLRLLEQSADVDDKMKKYH